MQIFVSTPPPTQHLGFKRNYRPYLLRKQANIMSLVVLIDAILGLYLFVLVFRCGILINLKPQNSFSNCKIWQKKQQQQNKTTTTAAMLTLTVLTFNSSTLTRINRACPLIPYFAFSESYESDTDLHKLHLKRSG